MFLYHNLNASKLSEFSSMISGQALRNNLARLCKKVILLLFYTRIRTREDFTLAFFMVLGRGA
jgi:hypothetical protein